MVTGDGAGGSPVDFYFDFSSPYGYFAAEKIDHVIAPFARPVIWHPILLGPALKKTGNRPLSDQPLKDDYGVYDWARLARFMDLPWSMPQTFPISTVKTARAFYAIDGELGGTVTAKKFAMAAYKAYFGYGRNINDLDVIADLAGQCGVDTDSLRQAVVSQAIKDRLRREVDLSLEKGVFGSPFVMVDGEKFWGSDRFWMIKRWLKSGGW